MLGLPQIKLFGGLRGLVKVYVYRRIRERNRWLRSDGTPNFNDRIHKKPSELQPVIMRDVPVASEESPILRITELMYESGYRMVPILSSKNIVSGVVTGMDIIDYLGGGPRYNIILSRNLNSIYDALDVSVDNVMRNNPITVSTDMTLPQLLEVMIKYGIGAVPVTDKEGKYVGLITERSLIRYLTGKVTGVLVKNVMTENVIYVTVDTNLGKAMKTMVNTGVRRLPVVKDGVVAGMLSCKDITGFIGSHKVFTTLKQKTIDELLNLPVSDVMRTDVLTISPVADIGEAASIMNVKKVGSLLVIQGGQLKGIITARDILYGTVAG